MVAAHFALLSLAVLSVLGLETAPASKLMATSAFCHRKTVSNMHFAVQNHDLDVMLADYSNETRPALPRRRSSQLRRVARTW